MPGVTVDAVADVARTLGVHAVRSWICNRIRHTTACAPRHVDDSESADDTGLVAMRTSSVKAYAKESTRRLA